MIQNREILPKLVDSPQSIVNQNINNEGAVENQINIGHKVINITL